MQVSRWGNSLAVRLPARLVAQLGLKEGDEVEIHPKEGALEIEKKPSIDELFERVRNMPNKLPADYKFNRRDAVRPGYEDRD